jgi:hypothetical protein
MATGFGCDTAGNITETINNNVEVAEAKSEIGTIFEMQTHSGKSELSEEFYVADTGITNEALNGQNGTSVVSGHEQSNSNTEFQRQTRTTVTALPAPVV